MPSPGPTELVIILVITAMFIALIYLLLLGVGRVLRRPGPAILARDPALDVLRTRLATGEIDDAEFRRLRAAIGDD